MVTIQKAVRNSNGFFFYYRIVFIYTHKDMTLKVVITYYAHQEDWDIQEVLDGRKVVDAQDELKEMLSEDVQYIWDNADITISESKNSI